MFGVYSSEMYGYRSLNNSNPGRVATVAVFGSFGFRVTSEVHYMQQLIVCLELLCMYEGIPSIITVTPGSPRLFLNSKWPCVPAMHVRHQERRQLSRSGLALGAVLAAAIRSGYFDWAIGYFYIT